MLTFTSTNGTITYHFWMDNIIQRGWQLCTSYLIFWYCFKFHRCWFRGSSWQINGGLVKLRHVWLITFPIKYWCNYLSIPKVSHNRLLKGRMGMLLMMRPIILVCKHKDGTPGWTRVVWSSPQLWSRASSVIRIPQIWWLDRMIEGCS